MTIIESIGVVCLTLAVVLEPVSYYRQIKKTLQTKKSSQVSSTSFVYRILKHVLTIIGLVIFVNYIGALVQFIGLIFCIVAFIIVCRFKPKGWKLF